MKIPDFQAKIHIDEMLIQECLKLKVSYLKIAIFNSMRKKLNFNNESKK